MERLINSRFCRRFIYVVLTSAFVIPSPSNAGAGNVTGGLDGDVARVWNKALLQAVLDTQPGVTVAARALAIVNTCMFDAWTYFDENAVPTQPATVAKARIVDRTLSNKNTAITAAAYTCLVDQFPARKAYFTAVMYKLGYATTGLVDGLATPAGYGYSAARLVLAYRHRDGSNQMGDLSPGSYTDYTGYHAANDPANLRDQDRWQPLMIPTGGGQFRSQSFATPHWGKVLPFALARGDQFRPMRPPASLSMSLLLENRYYQEQAREILQYTSGLTDEQKVIVDYWSDGPNTFYPPGHWCEIADFVSRRDKHGLDENVKMYFALSNALFDASIAAWDAKRTYDSVRPITAIRFLFQGTKIRSWAGPGLDNVEMLGEDWIPYLSPTPPFPDFVSGHSTFSSAAAEVLRRFTHSDVLGMRVVIPAGTSHIEPGITPKTDINLAWATFTDAAEQAGMSRRFGGIHFKDADLEGRQIGRKVGAAVWEKSARHFGLAISSPSEPALIMSNN